MIYPIEVYSEGSPQAKDIDNTIDDHLPNTIILPRNHLIYNILLLTCCATKVDASSLYTLVSH